MNKKCNINELDLAELVVANLWFLCQSSSGKSETKVEQHHLFEQKCDHCGHSGGFPSSVF